MIRSLRSYLVAGVVILLGVTVFSVAASRAADPEWRVGVARIKITPEHGGTRIEIGMQRWFDKAALAAVAVILSSGLLLALPALGAYWQHKLTEVLNAQSLLFARLTQAWKFQKSGRLAHHRSFCHPRSFIIINAIGRTGF